MIYASVLDFENHYQEDESAELSNLDETEMSANRTRIEQALAKASGEIDTIIGARYTLPIVVSVPYLKWESVAIARKILDSVFERDKTRLDYNDVISRLNNIAKGIGALIDESGKPVPLTPEIIAETTTDTSIYSGNRIAYIPNFGGVIQQKVWDSEREPRRIYGRPRIIKD
jgi:phage gp36-like protein